MRKQSTILVALILAVMLLTVGCSTNVATEEPTSAPAETAAATQPVNTESGNSPAKVFVSVALGGLGDNGYNDSAYAGAKKAEAELGIDLTVYEPTSISEIEAQMMSVAESGEYDLILGIGADNASGVEKAAAAYPDQAFACYQAEIDLPNVISSNLAMEEPGYQMGVLCALLLQGNALSGVPEGTHSIGVVLGTSSSEILTQVYSLEAGGLSVDPEFTVVVNEVGSWTDQAKAKELASALYEKGCGIVYQAAGGAGLGVFEAAKEYGGYVIGCSSNQNDLCDTVICSRMELMDITVFQTIAQFVSGQFTSGILRMGMKEQVCYNDFTGSKVTIPTDIMQKVEDIGQQIMDGKINIPTTQEALDTFKANLS